ncbi:adhesion G-protein coupled receptor D1-like [Xenia sp. Carnegie-2017]|uniref:adhesion G-protein coupled receptor D1-like n=1 Tax=Xenia sp. Carnegie-2017 TaxID=2897299 RepID=UPI001F0451F8|nr:adhesion G-protein coupled receptor D1-like [Xenia sp. Carnegie-2017]
MHSSGVQSETHLKVLEFISTIGCSVSLVGLVFTILMHVCFWKHVKSPRCIVLINLCIAIGFADIFAVVERVARGNPVTILKRKYIQLIYAGSFFCKSVAALLHYFLLSVFTWMLCEGILLYILVIRLFHNVGRKHIKIFNFIGWGIPLITIAASFVFENKLNLAFIIPACFVIAVNTVVLIMVIRKMMNTHKVRQQENIEKVKTGVRATIVILPILGLTWVFGLMAINEETVFFRYLFAIFNSAQGLLIFLFHCVLNKKMQEAVRKSSRRTFSLRHGGKKWTDLQNVSSSAPGKTLSSDRSEEKQIEKGDDFSNEESFLLSLQSQTRGNKDTIESSFKSQNLLIRQNLVENHQKVKHHQIHHCWKVVINWLAVNYDNNNIYGILSNDLRYERIFN